ncbi:DUF2630 family protein [soil metagenome]|jgi:hypothetical protein
MDDRTVLERIQALSHEEHELFERGGATPLDDADHNRLAELEVMLDQCWDLLRQRRARRNAGQDPDEAEARPIDTVETYRQ